MSTHEEAEAEIRRMEDYTPTADATVVACWREHMQPAVPPVPDGCELVDDDGVPVFRVPTEDDYGYLRQFGGVVLVGRYALPSTTSKFGGKRYIVRQSVPTEVERLAQALAASHWSAWEGLLSGAEGGYAAQAQRLYDHGVRCPEQTQDRPNPTTEETA